MVYELRISSTSSICITFTEKEKKGMGGGFSDLAEGDVDDGEMRWKDWNGERG